MTQVVTRLFDSHTQALAAVEALEQAGVDHDRISLIANNEERWHDGHKHPGGRHVDGDNEAAEGAAEGAGKGALLGGGAGLLAGLGMLAIPGLGPVVAAGWLASTAVGALVGAAAGGATGGILGALKDAGHDDDEAHVYAEGVRRGGSLVSVKPDNEAERTLAEQVLNGQGVSAADRGREYRAAGWERFDENASPYGLDEISAERDRYREQRSFRSDNDETFLDETRDNDGVTPNPLGGPTPTRF